MSVYEVTMKTVRVVSLPRELQSAEDVKRFMKERLDLDCLRVKIVNMRSESGVCFRSAFVDVDAQISQLSAATAVGHTIQSGCILGGIHFDNGKPMGHIKVVDVKSHPREKKTETHDKATIEKLKAEIATLKSYSVVPVPGMPIAIDVGQIIAENHRLKEEIERLKR